MKKKLVSDTLKRLSKKYAKSKKGATLVELVCTTAILAIVSTISLSSLYSLSSIAVKGQNISVAQRSCALLSEQLSIYTKNSPYLIGYNTFPTVNGYDETAPDETFFMDADVSNMGKYDEFMIYEGSQPNTIVLAKFNGNIRPFSKNSFEVVNTIDNIKSVEFKTRKLDGFSDKYLLEYSIVALESVHKTGEVTYTINGGVVLNNVKDASTQLSNTNIVVGDGTGQVLRIRATDRALVDRT